MSGAADLLARLFEGAPRFVDLLRREPNQPPAELLARAELIARQMPEADQIELLNGHPRIGADPATMSETSAREQGYDEDLGSEDLQARLERLNDAYEAQFGFRYVVFVAGRSRAEIAQRLELALEGDRSVELKRAIHDLFAIARDRLTRLSQTVEER